jgi:translation initiation factor 1
MQKKKSTSRGGLVYSTDPHFKLPEETPEEPETPDPALQKLSIRLDTKHRAGKAVTLVQGFAGTAQDLQELGKKLKSFCGTGGSVKDGEIIVQGDNREKIWQWLMKNGYRSSRKL